MKSKEIIVKYYPYILALILLYFVWKYFSGISISGIENYLTFSVILFCCLYYAILVKGINTLRYSSFLGISKIKKLYFVILFSNFLLNFIPFRAGEYSYIKLFRSKFNISKEKSIPALIVIRFYDYITIALFFFLSIFFIGSYFTNLSKGIVLLLVFIIPIIFLLILILSFKFQSKIGKSNNKILIILNKSLNEIKNYSVKNNISLFIYSILYWGVRFMFGYVLLIFLGIKLSFMLVVFISSLLILAGMIPIQIFSNFGIFEFGWIFVINKIGLGIENQELFNKILAFHIIPLIPVIIFGIISYFFLRTSNSK